MAKRIEIDGKYYRLRRGKLVEIPPEWVGSTAHPQTIRKRASKQSGKKRERKGIQYSDSTYGDRIMSDARAPLASEWD